jgi:HEPN domain-containing protein/predicted nucleotidyltransferase
MVRPLNEPVLSRLKPVGEELLREITKRIVKAFRPEKVILFGSHAYGEPTAYSDIDLLVIMNGLRGESLIARDQNVAQVAHSAAMENGDIPIDVLVRSPSELSRRLKIGDPFFREVMLKGRVLYSRPGSNHRLDAKKWRGRMPEPALVAEWVRKAEADFSVAAHIVRQRKDPQPDLACYHCQQCAEKYQKAFLLQHSVSFERTHDLAKLNRLCATVDGSFLFIHDRLALLNPYSIEARYPGRVIEMPEAHEALAAVKKVRKFIREKMNVR